MIENYKNQKEQQKNVSPKPLLAGIAILGIVGGGAVMATNHIKTYDSSMVSVSANTNQIEQKTTQEIAEEDEQDLEEEQVLLDFIPQIVAKQFVETYFTRESPEDFGWVEKSEHLATEQLVMDLGLRGFPPVSPLNHAGAMRVVEVVLQDEHDLGTRFEARAIATIETQLIGVVRYPLDVTLFLENGRWVVFWAVEDQGLGAHHD